MQTRFVLNLLLMTSQHLFWNLKHEINFVQLPIQVGDLGYASELGNYAEYSGAPNEEEVLQYARVVIDVSKCFLFFPLGISCL